MGWAQDVDGDAAESRRMEESSSSVLYRCGLIGEGLDMICVDGGTGLLAATLQVKAPLREGRLQERSNI